MGFSDIELMQKVKSGSESAFTKIVQRYQEKINNFFYKSLWDRALAEELVQEVFIRLFKSAKNYYPKAKFTTFLFRIARNILIDYFRSKEAKFNPVSLDNKSEDINDVKCRLKDSIASEKLTPSEKLLDNELFILIAVKFLPDCVYQYIFKDDSVKIQVWKKHNSGCSIREIADFLSIIEITVQSKIKQVKNSSKDIKVWHLYKDGKSVQYIAEFFDIAIGTVRNIKSSVKKDLEACVGLKRAKHKCLMM